jgi:hypothetical protein
VGYDEFGFVEDWENPAPLTPPEEVSGVPHVPIRVSFPPAGSDYMGGTCDGHVYRTVFAGATSEKTYSLVRAFLVEEGYSDIPIPETADELLLFKRPRNPQLQLFELRGYIHNPVKILFPRKPPQKHALILELYNEQSEHHLLRFHGFIQ